MGHLLDSTLLGAGFGSVAMRDLFTDERLLQAWLDVEAALATVQADLGLVPVSAAREIARAANAADFDLAVLGREIEATSHPLMPVVRALAARCSDDADRYVHWGATTQDITDTALVLQIRDALDLLEERLLGVRRRLVELAAEHRDTIMAGRTHGQQALPTTAGFKFAVLASEFARHEERLVELRPRLLAGQLGGAVGSLASLGDDGIATRRALCERLGLRVPEVPWHTSRDAIAELVAWLAIVAATAEKVAEEVRVLQRTEVAELEEPNPAEKVGSSTMPHKRNPMVAENLIAAARLTRQAPGLAIGAMVQEHERDMRTWGVEWAVVPETFILVAGALERLRWILDGLEVNARAMKRNLGMLDGLMLSEAVMMELARTCGRQEAHAILHDVTARVSTDKVSFAEALKQHPTIAEALSPAALEAALDPARYLGAAMDFVDVVVRRLENAPAGGR